MPCSAMEAEMGKDSSADGMGRTRGRQLGPLTRMLPDLVELELSWLISTSITPHCTRERESARVEGAQQGLVALSPRRMP